MNFENKYKSIQTRLLQLSIGMICPIVLIMMIVVSYIINVQIEKQYVEGINEKIEIVSNGIDNFYNMIDQNINMLANNPIIMNSDSTITKYINEETQVYMTPSKNGGIEQEIYEIFNQYASNHLETRYVYLATVDGGYINWPETYITAKYNPIVREWYKLAIEGQGEIKRTEPYIDKNNVMVTSNVRAVYDSDGNIKGVVGIDVKEDAISNMLNNMKNGDTGFYIIAHENGTILADGKNKENNNKNISEINIEGLDKILDFNINEFECVINGEKYIVNSKKVQESSWIIASLISQKELKKYTININLIFLLISIIMIGIMSYIITNNLKKITIPIKDAANYLTEIGNGNFEQEIKSEYLKRNDEIGIIINGINSMKHSIVELIYEIKNELRIFKKISDESKRNCIIIYDEFYNVTYRNNAAREYYKNNNDVYYKSIKSINDLWENKISEEEYKKIINSLKISGYWSGILEVHSANKFIKCSAQYVFNDNGDRNTVVKFNDITERMNEERKLIQYEKMKSQETLRNNFFANISHELKTPLNIFCSTLQLLDIKNKNNCSNFGEEYLKHRQCLKINCKRMLRLINNIVDITKIDVGFTKANFTNNDIVRVVEEITLSVVNYAEPKNIEIIFDTEVEEHIIKFDLDMVERIMLNLLSNAIKFTENKGHIWVNVFVDNEYVHIVVKDDGIGIPMEIQEYIFERFVQNDKSFTRLNEGSGIGLTIVKSLVKLNDGKIYLKSDGKRGTEFEVLLPNTKLDEVCIDDKIYEIDMENTELELSDIYS